MSKEAVVAVVEQPGALAVQDAYVARLAAIRNVICKDATDDELKFFAGVCQAKKMDPFGQQIFLVKRNGKNGPQLAIQTGVDGFRAQAARSGEYGGNDEPVFTYGSEGDTKAEKNPIKASVTVYRMIQGQRVAFTATARWSEFFPGETMGFMWKAKPHVMLGKCAECQALRKAFPNECGGLYESAELERVEEVRPAIQVAADLNAKFAQKAIQASAQSAPTADVMKAIEAFKFINVDENAIAAKLGHTGAWSVPDLDKLRAWYEELTAQRQEPAQ